MTTNEAIKQVSQELELPEDVVRRAYYSMFEFIKETAMELPLKEEFLSRENLRELKKVFHLPLIGKITVPYSQYKRIWEAYLNKRKRNV